MRLYCHQLLAPAFERPSDVTSWMGAMQAQDYQMVKWALGVRLPGATAQSIEADFAQGHILRTHLMRPTWHLVSSTDIYWILELTAPNIHTSMKTRHKELELTAPIIAKSNKLISKALELKGTLSREALVTMLNQAKIRTTDNRASHLLLCAELAGIICSGPYSEKVPTYSLLEERVPHHAPIRKEEALYRLAKAYFTSHCPATLQDFTWWSGLPAKDAKAALESIKEGFRVQTIQSQDYWLPANFQLPEMPGKTVHLLPAFDEYLISYKDRSTIIRHENHKKAVSNNGIFWPIIVVDGQVTGTWKRTIKKHLVEITTTLFRKHSQQELKTIRQKAMAYAAFLQKDIQLIT